MGKEEEKQSDKIQIQKEISSCGNGGIRAILKKCPFYPCHEEMDDCTFCYCPIYPCNISELGKWNQGIWDCSNCKMVHDSAVVEELKKFIIEYIEEIVRSKNE